MSNNSAIVQPTSADKMGKDELYDIYHGERIWQENLQA